MLLDKLNFRILLAIKSDQQIYYSLDIFLIRHCVAPVSTKELISVCVWIDFQPTVWFLSTVFQKQTFDVLKTSSPSPPPRAPLLLSPQGNFTPSLPRADISMGFS